MTKGSQAVTYDKCDLCAVEAKPMSWPQKQGRAHQTSHSALIIRDIMQSWVDVSTYPSRIGMIRFHGLILYFNEWMGPPQIPLTNFHNIVTKLQPSRH